MANKIQSFRDLKIWRQGIAIVKNTYFLTARFPKKELFGLSNQMQRAAVSIPSNIAEGHNRAYSSEYGRFLNIALGSCAELETQAVIAKELGYITDNLYNQFVEKLRKEEKQVYTVLRKLRQSPTPDP